MKAHTQFGPDKSKFLVFIGLLVGFFLISLALYNAIALPRPEVGALGAAKTWEATATAAALP